MSTTLIRQRLKQSVKSAVTSWCLSYVFCVNPCRKMGNYCPPRLNRDYCKSLEGIFKVVLIVIGLFSWGLVYVGDVMSTSNEAPEINDQALFCSALSLPTWLMTVITYIIFIFIRTDVIPFRFNAGLDIVLAILHIACVAYCASYQWFVWLCASGSSVDVVDTGECPEERILRNDGQNLAVLVLMSILAAVYATAGIITFIHTRKKPEERGPQGKPLNATTETENL